MNKDNKLVGMVTLADLTRSGAGGEAAMDQVTEPSDKPRQM